MKKPFLVLVLALLLPGMAAAAAGKVHPASVASATAELNAARKTIQAVNTDWVPALQARDAARLVKPYAQNAIDIDPQGEVIVGRAAMQKHLQEGFAKGGRVLSGVLHQEGVRYVDGLVIEWGHGALRSLDAGGRIKVTGGPYLTVWQKNKDGIWQIIRNMSF